jgi:hypothetical protein
MVRRSAGDRPRLPVRQSQDQTTKSESGPERHRPAKGSRGKPDFSDFLDRLSKGIRIPAGSTFSKVKGD